MIVLLKSQQQSTNSISSIVGVSENTVRNHLHAYLEGGIQNLTEVSFNQPQSELKSFDERIKDHFSKNPPSTIKQACAEVASLTGINRRETQMKKYLKSLGLRRRKVAAIPAKADIQDQETFKKTQLEPRLEEAKAGLRDVYFVDAVHFVLGAYLTYLWSIARMYVKTPSGRQRFNVSGALNAITHELTTVTNTTYINATSVCDLLKKLAENARKPITLVVDNARYQRCRLVIELAQELNIELLFLPPYSPNLNLIERLWKLTKKHCLNSKYHEDFSEFQAAITDFLEHMNERNTAELDSLLTLNFQAFTTEQILKAA